MKAIYLTITLIFAVTTVFAQVDDDDVVINIKPITKKKTVVKAPVKPTNKAEEVVSKYLDMITRDMSLDDLKSLRTTYDAKMNTTGVDLGMDDMQFTMKWSYYDHDTMMFDISMDGMMLSSTYMDRGKSYTAAQGSDWVEGPAVRDYKTIMNRSLILDYNFLSNPDITLNYKGIETVNGIRCHVIEVPNASSYEMQVEGQWQKGKEDLVHYYREDNYLLQQSDRTVYVSDSYGSEPTTLSNKTISTYSNYQWVDGLFYPHTMKYIIKTGDASEMAMLSELKSIEMNPSLEEVKF